MGALSFDEAVREIADTKRPHRQGVGDFRKVNQLRQHSTRDSVLADDTRGRLRHGYFAPVQPETRRSSIADGEDEVLSSNPFGRLPSTQHHVLWSPVIDSNLEPSVGVGQNR